MNARAGTAARHAELLSLVRSGVTSAEGLAGHLGVSLSTVRRDLARLAADGRLARTYGGALAAEFTERPFEQSTHLRQADKEAIAARAAALLAPGQSVFVDAGTTCLALARRLPTLGPRTVITRGLEAALALASAPGIEVILLGGSVRPLSHGLVGPLARLVLDRVTVDVAFLGADVIDADRGLGEPTLAETGIKEAVAARAAHTILLADSGKADSPAAPAWLPLRESWALVTDAGLPAATHRALSGRIRVLIAGDVASSGHISTQNVAGGRG